MNLRKREIMSPKLLTMFIHCGLVCGLISIDQPACSASSYNEPPSRNALLRIQAAQLAASKRSQSSVSTQHSNSSYENDEESSEDFDEYMDKIDAKLQAKYKREAQLKARTQPQQKSHTVAASSVGKTQIERMAEKVANCNNCGGLGMAQRDNGMVAGCQVCGVDKLTPAQWQTVKNDMYYSRPENRLAKLKKDVEVARLEAELASLKSGKR